MWYAGPIEAVHIKYCKYILRVSSSTSNAAVMGELGRHPLYIHYFCRCVIFWFNIIHNNASAPRLRTSMYNNLKRLDDNGRHTSPPEIGTVAKPQSLALARHNIGIRSDILL